MDHPSANNIIDLYQRNSAYWDAIRSEHLYESPWLEWFLALPPAVADVLDLGCGSGKPIGSYFVEPSEK